MIYKSLFITLLIYSLLGCSEKEYRNIYENQENIFGVNLKTRTENDNDSIKNGINPIKRPSYNEYKEQWSKKSYSK